MMIDTYSYSIFIHLPHSGLTTGENLSVLCDFCIISVISKSTLRRTNSCLSGIIAAFIVQNQSQYYAFVKVFHTHRVCLHVS